VLIACESKDKKARFIAMEVVDSICHFSVDKFVKKHLKRGQNINLAGLALLTFGRNNFIGKKLIDLWISLAEFQV
jgi:hypothetical protein